MTQQIIPQAPKPLIRARNVYLLLICLTLIAGGVFGFMKGNEFLNTQQSLVSGAALSETLQKESDSVSKTFDDVLKTYEIDKTKYEKTAFSILPGEEKLINVTKSLDDFFDKNFQKENEILASNLRFGSGVKVQGKPYSTLPFSLTITASREKFEKFLKFVESSGSFEAAAAGALNSRLFDLQAIRLNLSSNEESKDEVSFTVDLRAFYRNTKSS